MSIEGLFVRLGCEWTTALCMVVAVVSPPPGRIVFVPEGLNHERAPLLRKHRTFGKGRVVCHEVGEMDRSERDSLRATEMSGLLRRIRRVGDRRRNIGGLGRVLAGHPGEFLRVFAWLPGITNDTSHRPYRTGTPGSGTWDAGTGRELWTLHGRASRLYALAFSPDGNTLASSAVDGVLRLWEAHSAIACPPT
jgi:WD domain, G-beta repeat